MKRISYITSLLCAVALAGCTNDDFVENNPVAPETDGVTLFATAGSDTRTTVDGINVYWSEINEGVEKDAFYAYGDGKVYGVFEFQGYVDSDKSQGKFKGTLKNSKNVSDLKYAVYPSANYTPSTKALKFPNSYTYPNSNAPMFGTYNTTTSKMEFKQFLCGMIRVQLSGFTENKASDGHLTLTASGIVGTKTIEVSADGVASFKTETSNSTTSSTDAVTVNFKSGDFTDGSLTLDIPVPAGTYKFSETEGEKGIKVELFLGNNTTPEETLFAANDENGFVVEKGNIHTMAAFAVVSIEGSTYTFASYVADNITDANAKLKTDNGCTIKSIAILNYTNGDELEVPTAYTEDNPLTVYLPKKDANCTLKVKEGSGTASEGQAKVRRTVQTRADEETQAGATTAEASKVSVILNAPADNKSTVSLSNIGSTELQGSFGKAEVGTGCSEITVAAAAEVTTVAIQASASVSSVTIEAKAAVKEVTVASGAKVETISVDETATSGSSEDSEEASAPKIEIASGATVTDVSGEITVDSADALKAALSGTGTASVKLTGDITIPASADSVAVSGTKVLDLNGQIIQLNTETVARTERTGAGRALIVVGTGADLTIKDTGTGGTITNEVSDNNTTAQDRGKGLIRVYSAKLTLENITLIDDLEQYAKYTSDGLIDAAVVYQGASDVHVEGCNITSGTTCMWGVKADNTSTTYVKDCICDGYGSNARNNFVYCLLLRGTNATVENCIVRGIQGALCLSATTATINGGTYCTRNKYSEKDAWHALYITNGCKATIKGGNFWSPNAWHDMGSAIGGMSCVYASDDDSNTTPIGVIVSIANGCKFNGKPYVLEKKESNGKSRTVFALSADQKYKNISETETVEINNESTELTFNWEVVESTATTK